MAMSSFPVLDLTWIVDFFPQITHGKSQIHIQLLDILLLYATVLFQDISGGHSLAINRSCLFIFTFYFYFLFLLCCKKAAQKEQ